MQRAMQSDQAKSSGAESPTGDTTAQGAAAAAAEFPSLGNPIFINCKHYYYNGVFNY